MTNHRATDFAAEAAGAYHAQLADLLASRPDADLGDPLLAGRQAALSTIAALVWAEEIGPFLDTSGAQVMLGDVTKQAVSERVARRRLLALRMGPDGRTLRYPIWQFEAETLQGLGPVLDAVGLDVGVRWHAAAVASWLCAPDPRLDGLRPRDLLAAGRADGLAPLLGEVRYQLGGDEADVEATEVA